MFSFKATLAIFASIALLSGGYGLKLPVEDIGGSVGNVIGNGKECVGGIVESLLGQSQEIIENLLATIGGAPGGLGLPIVGDITELPDFLTDFLEKIPKKLLPKVVKILSDTTLTVEQVIEKLTKLLKGKLDENLIAKLLASVAELVEKLLDGIAKILGNLGNVFEDIKKILDNKNQKIEDQKEAINKLKKQFPIEVDTIFHIAAQVALSLQGNGTVDSKVSA
ncbi:Protein CBG10502 [Caenorhabditis briggsae]|uniref:Protein CBG10502 n=2 Tax=Caenorhabditis briggsae TaxID=6238 RepID=A8XAY4_CAEBR|nr:Protein CBG10502 [Caenorhabditis briggsae]ULT87006.1 hypothetical protein L3Y34_006634 [Caenorhabditis briggsae]CAP29912.1 Protein CBG10502 [Caenorhabditis briggsae]